MTKPKNEVALPEGIARSLDRIEKRHGKKRFGADVPGGEFVGDAMHALVRGWKEYTLHAPHKFIGYSLRNWTGDIDIVFAALPGAATPQRQWAAWKMLSDYYGKKTAEIPEVLQTAIKLGVVNSSVVQQELLTLKDYPKFAKMLDAARSGKRSLVNPKDILDGYREWAQTKSNVREAILRLSVFMYLREKSAKGKHNHYGASDAIVIDALRDQLGDDWADARLARELLGDYGNISVFGQWMRDSLVPFWSFQELNLRAYPRIFQNAWRSGDSSMPIIKAMGKKTAVAGAVATARIGFWYMLASMFNHYFWDDDREEGLAEWERMNPHLTLWKTPDGRQTVFRNVGRLGDFLEWGGINQAQGDIPALVDGQVSAKDLAYEMRKAPLKKFVGGVGPWIKGPFELLTGQTLFPDPMKSRPKDRDETFFGYAGVEEEYKLFKSWLPGSGDSARPYNYYKFAGLAATDPAKAAFDDIHSLRFKFYKSINEPLA